MAAYEYLENSHICSVGHLHPNLKPTFHSENSTNPFCLQHLFNCENSTLETYFCKKCDFQTTLMILLKEHFCTSRKQHSNDITHCIQTYICKRCNFETHFNLKWLKHLTHCLTKSRKVNPNTTHFQNGEYTLDNQDLTSTVQQNLEQWVKCEYCPFKTKLITSLTLHNHIKHKSVNALSQHDVHPKPTKASTQFRCDRCPFVTKQKRHLQLHLMYLHAPQKWHRCEKCTYKTRSSNNLNAHKKHHLENENPVCDKCKTQHPSQKCAHDAEITWLHCEHCPSRFKEKSWLKYHVHFEHVKNVLFECEHCPYKSNRRSKLNKHVIARHKHENDIKWYKCDHCDFKSKENLGLRRHVVRKHTSEEHIRWFKCDICPYKTKQNGGLINHTIRKHLKEDEIQWFQCRDCSYKAKTKDYLRKHEVLRHVDREDVEWFECDECGFRTKVKMYMNTHKKRRHSRKTAIS